MANDKKTGDDTANQNSGTNEQDKPGTPPAVETITREEFEIYKQLTETRINVLEEELVNKEETIEDLSGDVARLSKEKARKPTPVSEMKPLKVGKKLYRFAFPATFWKGKKITAEDVRDSDELITELIAAGSGMLVEQ